MQFDDLSCEGTEEFSDTQGNANLNCNTDVNNVNLEQHFRNNGLSVNAYNKISNDINNGDLNVTMLISCNEKQLNKIADGYKLTWLQKETFVNACKLLNQTPKQKQQEKEKEKEFIYITPNEQNILMKFHN